MSTEAEDDRLIAYWWKYDNRAYGFALLDMRKQKHMQLSQTKQLDCRKDLEVLLSDLGDDWRHGSPNLKEEKEERILVTKKLKLHSGLQYFKDHDEPKRSKKRGKFGQQELKKFLLSCGDSPENRKEVLCLFSGILSGYCARIVIPIFQKKYPSVLQDRAPVLQITGAYNVFNFMLKTISALAVSTDYGNKVLKSKSVSFFPSSVTQRNFEECAALHVRKSGKKSHRFPVQYRDTSVLIHGRFFQERKIRSFINRNL